MYVYYHTTGRPRGSYRLENIVIILRCLYPPGRTLLRTIVRPLWRTFVLRLGENPCLFLLFLVFIIEVSTLK